MSSVVAHMASGITPSGDDGNMRRGVDEDVDAAKRRDGCVQRLAMASRLRMSTVVTAVNSPR